MRVAGTEHVSAGEDKPCSVRIGPEAVAQPRTPSKTASTAFYPMYRQIRPLALVAMPQGGMATIDGPDEADVGRFRA